MSEAQLLEVQQGIWIDKRWLQSAGLGARLQVIVRAGEIRIVTAPMDAAAPVSTETGWSIFRSLGDDAPVGKLQNAAENHDRYLYGKKK